MREILNSMRIGWFGDVVLQKLPGDIYVEVANRKEAITNKVWNTTDVLEYKKQGNIIQIIDNLTELK